MNQLKKKYEAVVFDMDGTLLDTLEDLMNSTNYALKAKGLPLREKEEIRHFVGNGVQKLIERAVPENTDAELTSQVFQIFKEHYVMHCNDKTNLYSGIMELLHELKQKNFKIAVVSNKLQEGVDALTLQYFQGIFDAAVGAREGIEKKPAPDMVFLALDEMQVLKEGAVYVGDSEVDIATARNSELPCITVTWGFRTREEQEAAGAELFAETPEEIMKYLYES